MQVSCIAYINTHINDTGSVIVTQPMGHRTMFFCNMRIFPQYQYLLADCAELVFTCSPEGVANIPAFIELIQYHPIICFVETQINDIHVNNVIIPVGSKGKFKDRIYVSKVKYGGISVIYKE